MVEIDVRGKVCPYPVIVTLEKLSSLKKGEVLEILTDESLAVRRIPEEAKRMGLKVEVEKMESWWKIKIEK